MKFLKQFGIILLISFIGELLYTLLPFPVPASIYGIMILFLCLQTGLVRLDAVKETSDFLIEIMPVMFVPAAAGLMDSWQAMKEDIVAYAVITALTTCLVMIVSGRVVQFGIQFGMRRDRHE
ncbi:CidA/LrgA family protein [Lachnospiraceae bacterium]|nr:CidA/LrgA family protein [Lachnospiraceae bacterium]